MESVSFAQAKALAVLLKSKVGEIVFGQEHLIDEVLCALLAGGHILVTGAPGLAKTTLVRAISKQLGLAFGRVQFTPDLLPSDILGSEVLNMDSESGRRAFEFAPGPIFANLLLADEINRASPRTQSALLEAMQERAVTIGKKTHLLPLPFMVFATQNPLESEGTFPLPEAQMDRFLLHSLVSYPDPDAELKMLKQHSDNTLYGERQRSDVVDAGDAVLSHADVQGMINATSRVRVEGELLAAIRDLIRSSRPEDPGCPAEIKGDIAFGAGPRAGLSLVSSCRSLALLNGSEEVRWHHVRRMAPAVLRHRIALSMRALGDGQSEDRLIEQLLVSIENRFSSLLRKGA